MPSARPIPVWQECTEEMLPLLDLAKSKASSRGETAADSRYSRERLDLVLVNLSYNRFALGYALGQLQCVL